MYNESEQKSNYIKFAVLNSDVIYSQVHFSLHFYEQNGDS